MTLVAWPLARYLRDKNALSHSIKSLFVTWRAYPLRQYRPLSTCADRVRRQDEIGLTVGVVGIDVASFPVVVTPEEVTQLVGEGVVSPRTGPGTGRVGLGQGVDGPGATAEAVAEGIDQDVGEIRGLADRSVGTWNFVGMKKSQTNVRTYSGKCTLNLLNFSSLSGLGWWSRLRC